MRRTNYDSAVCDRPCGTGDHRDGGWPTWSNAGACDEGLAWWLSSHDQPRHVTRDGTGSERVRGCLRCFCWVSPGPLVLYQGAGAGTWAGRPCAATRSPIRSSALLSELRRRARRRRGCRWRGRARRRVRLHRRAALACPLDTTGPRRRRSGAGRASGRRCWRPNPHGAWGCGKGAGDWPIGLDRGAGGGDAWSWRRINMPRGRAERCWAEPVARGRARGTGSTTAAAGSLLSSGRGGGAGKVAAPLGHCGIGKGEEPELVSGTRGGAAAACRTRLAPVFARPCGERTRRLQNQEDQDEHREDRCGRTRAAWRRHPAGVSEFLFAIDFDRVVLDASRGRSCGPAREDGPVWTRISGGAALLARGRDTRREGLTVKVGLVRTSAVPARVSRCGWCSAFRTRHDWLLRMCVPCQVSAVGGLCSRLRRTAQGTTTSLLRLNAAPPRSVRSEKVRHVPRTFIASLLPILALGLVTVWAAPGRAARSDRSGTAG